MASHKTYMKRALELAQLGLKNAAPNPLVGCVIVCKDKIIGEGFHRKHGEPHAEPNAIRTVQDQSLLPHSTLYVTLEPCSHFGKTPPCANLIIKKGIKKVVISNLDPFEKVNGSGIKKLLDAGIEVITGVLEKEGRYLNRRFFKFHEQKQPYIILKWAESYDGFVGSIDNSIPLQISNKQNASLVHKWRAEEDAIMVGVNTLINDNPKLNVRHVEGANPTRIIMDSGSSELDYPSMNFAQEAGKTLIFNKTIDKKLNDLEFIKLNNFSIPGLLSELYKRNIQSLIVEGGPKLHAAFIDKGLWDEARITRNKLTVTKGIRSARINGHFTDKIKSGNSCSVHLISHI
ncbi:MAG: bifunctional diaminohydroxyphosphoribosylaminopyrimidine deaminase/5-amino-6-(5-phosphoribosylamino)uracil reductase RibD [Salibacteraceae bacterium]